MENTIQINDLILKVTDTLLPEQELERQSEFYRDLYQRFDVISQENEELMDSVENVYFIQSKANLDFPFYLIISEEGACVAFKRANNENVEPIVKTDCECCNALERLKVYFKSKEPYRIYRVDSELNVYVPTEIETFLLTAL